MRHHHFSSACSYLPDTFTLQRASFTLFSPSLKDKHEKCQGPDLQSNKRKPACCNKCFNRILPLIVLLKASVTYEPPCIIHCNCNVNTCIRIFVIRILSFPDKQWLMVVWLWCKLIGSVSGIAHAEQIPSNGASFRGKIFLFWVKILLLCIS